MRLFHSNSLAVADGLAGHNGLGGRVSSDEIIGLSTRFVFAGAIISGISNANGKGIGRIWYTAGSPAKLAWQAPNSTAKGADVSIPTDGTYVLTGAGGETITLDVIVGNLPLASSSAAVYIDTIKNVLFSDISIADAMAGFVDYRCFFLENNDVSPYNFVRPRFSTNYAALDGNYPVYGNATIKLVNGVDFPDGCFIRNRRTKEIMYVSGRVNNINTLVVQSTARGLRDTSAAAGFAGDVMETISCLDINVAPYNPLTGTDLIPDIETAPPVSFMFPESLDDPQYDSQDLAAADLFVVWLRRTIPAGATQLAKTPLAVDFVYDV